MQKQLTIQSAEQLKSGVGSNGRQWVLSKYGVNDAIGSFTSFKGYRVGQAVSVSLVQGKNPNYPNDWSEEQPPSKQAQQESKVLDALRKVYEKLNAIEAKIDELVPADSPEDWPATPEGFGTEDDNIPVVETHTQEELKGVPF